MDPHFRVELLEKTPNPQRLIWISGHQCVCEGAAIDDPCPPEDKAGEYVVKHLLAGHRGHYSPLESAQISFNAIGFNHRTMQQLTRHRIGVHFSVQSFRYSGDRFAALGEKLTEIGYLTSDGTHWVEAFEEELESLFYLRPVGFYDDRDSGRYEYTEDARFMDLIRCATFASWYYKDIKAGKSHEQAAGLLPMDTRQNWVMSFNVRSLMHVLDLRLPKNAQLEIRWLCDLIWPHFTAWVPAIAEWYEQNRKGKARLAP